MAPGLSRHFWKLLAFLLAAGLAAACGGQTATPPTLAPKLVTRSPAPTQTASPTATRTAPGPTRTVTPTLTLDPRGVIEGVVYGGLEATGTPVAGVVVEILENPPAARATTQGEGAFRLEGIQPEIYHVLARAPDGLSAEKSVAVAAGQVTRVEFYILQHVVPLKRKVDSVIRCGGRIVPGAKVWIAGTSEVYTADENGRVAYYLPPANTSLLVDAGDCGGVLTGVREGRFDIQLQPDLRPPRLPLNPVFIRPDINLDLLVPYIFATPTPSRQTIRPVYRSRIDPRFLQPSPIP
jgi:hypothetical protein